MIKLLTKLFICLMSAGTALYVTVSEQNQVMAMRRAIPPLAKEVRAIQEENHHLQYVIDRFENPVHLIELSRKPEYGHLKYPRTADVIILQVPQER